MRYLSLCSGIEAATRAWHRLGWSPVAFSEIEPFPCAVLAHHYGSNLPGEDPAGANGVPNLGDMTRFKEWPDYAIDLLVGGTPCQDYSIAGARAGMAGSRGQLTLTYVEIAARYRPDWLVWENVPGVLSSNGGRDFARFLGDLSGTKISVPEGGWKTAGIVSGIADAYGLSYRVLDAQYVRTRGLAFAVPQRRRRVFVVGYLGDWRRAATVFIEPEGLRGDSPPRRQAGEKSAPTISARSKGGGGLGTDFDLDGGLIHQAFGGNNTRGAIDVATAAKAHPGRMDFEGDTFIVNTASDVAPTMRAGGNVTGGTRPYGTDVDTCDSLVAMAIQERATSENPDHGPDGLGMRTDGASYTLEARTVPQAVAFVQNGRDEVRLHGADGQSVGALAAHPGMKQQSYIAKPVAFDMRDREGGAMPEGPHDTANLRAASGGSSRSYLAEPTSFRTAGDGAVYDEGQRVASLTTGTDPLANALLQDWIVRRLTPRECERLQGFPDDFTRIPYRGKAATACPDGPRYKALGNSMAVNVMEWIGERIAEVDKMP